MVPPPLGSDAFSGSRLGPENAARLHKVFAFSHNPMLIGDDERRWITANPPALELLRLKLEDVPWLRMDDFTPLGQRDDLKERWSQFLAGGLAEGWYSLLIDALGGDSPYEFSAAANVLPSRHLAVFIPPEGPVPAGGWAGISRAPSWTLLAEVANTELTGREREILTLVAGGCQGKEIAERLVVSPETVKTHMQNVLRKLGTNTRAGAVAIALVSGQIDWDPQD